MDSPPIPSRWRVVALQTALLASAFFLALFNLEPGAPLYHLFGAPLPAQQQATLAALQSIDANFRATAAGGNLLLHLPGWNLNDPAQAMHAGALYYRANYDLFPHRAYVGDRPRVVNMADQLIPFDDDPPPTWMATHDIRGVCVYPGPAAAPR